MTTAGVQCRICPTNSRRRLKLTVVVFVAFVLMYVGLSFVNFSPYTGNKVWKTSPPCFDSNKPRTPLVKLAYKIHLILDGMGIEHWLMYGSLWGPLRGIPGPLPWDYDVDIGISGDGNFSKVPFEEFKARFIAAGLKVTDKSLRSGNLMLVDQNGEKCDVFIYYNQGGVMELAGYETWIFFINYQLYHSFPAILVKQPLPKVRFCFFNISVPRGGIEIMKYSYPFSWWKVVKPANCEQL